MDYTTIIHLKSRSIIADKYKEGIQMITQIKQYLRHSEQTLNNSLEEAEGYNDVSEANIDAALAGLRRVLDTVDNVN